MALAAVVKDHFRGAMLGVVIGDCLGSFWENSTWKKTLDIDDVQRKIDEQVEQSLRRHFRISYTDDTTMTFGMAESLLECRAYDAKDMAKRWCHYTIAFCTINSLNSLTLLCSRTNTCTVPT